MPTSNASTLQPSHNNSAVPGPRTLLDSSQRENAGITCRDVCWLFCCPPWPSSIAAKLAFVPPEASYKLALTAGTHEETPRATSTVEKYSIALNDPLDWHFVPRDLDGIDAFLAPTSRGEKVACMYMRIHADARWTMLFSHGNAVDLGQMCSFYWALGKRLGVNIFSYDYSGYGMSSGVPSEQNVYSDIEGAWKALQKRYGIKAENVILYGQSIGTVATVDLAAKEKFGGVILHGTLASGLRVAFPETRRNWFFDVFKSKMKWEVGKRSVQDRYVKWRTLLACNSDEVRHFSIDKAGKIHSKTLVIHGSEDEVIPVTHGISIYERLPRAVDPLFIEGAGHNDVELFAQYYDRLKRFITEDLVQQDSLAAGDGPP